MLCLGQYCSSDPELFISVADPEESETFGRIRSGTEKNVSDPDIFVYTYRVGGVVGGWEAA